MSRDAPEHVGQRRTRGPARSLNVVGGYATVRVERLVLDQDPVQHARKVIMVALGVMHRRPIIPEGDRSLTPAELRLVLRTTILVENRGEDRLRAFCRLRYRLALRDLSR